MKELCVAVAENTGLLSGFLKLSTPKVTKMKDQLTSKHSSYSYKNFVPNLCSTTDTKGQKGPSSLSLTNYTPEEARKKKKAIQA